MGNRLSVSSRLIVLLSAITIGLIIFVPIWRIELDAPQYPEGLKMYIHANKLTGDVQIINGLNHYIGMRELHAEDFIEFTVLPYILGVIAFFGLLTALINRRWFFYTWAAIFIIFAVGSMVDFYLWLHNYGHNLDPAAPLKVPGMSYSPPLLGFKQLLNFGAFSIPDIGGWMLFGVGILILIAFIIEIRKTKIAKAKVAPIAAFILLIGLSACSTGPQPINYDVDNCDFCRMTIVDELFGSEIVTKKGRVYKFDDVSCMASFIQEETVKKEDIKDIYFIDYSNPKEFVINNQAHLIYSEEILSPMASGVAVFSKSDDAEKYSREFNAQKISWDNYLDEYSGGHVN